MVVAFGVAESPEGDSLYAYPAGESLWSPNGVAKIMQGAKPVRLAAEAFLLFVQKEPKYAWGCAPRPRRVGTPRPESQSDGFPENWGPRRDARPAGERRTHRSGEGGPKRSKGSARLKRRLRPTRRRL